MLNQSDQPEENQDSIFFPERPQQTPSEQPADISPSVPSTSSMQDTPLTPSDTPSADAGTPPPPFYDQPAFYQQPEYATPPSNPSNQPPYAADTPSSESAPPPAFETNNVPYGQNIPPPFGQPPYSYAQAAYGYATTAIPAAQPLPLGQAICQLPGQYWRVLTHPSASTFAYEQGKAAWNIIWVQIGVFMIFRIIILALRALEPSRLSHPLNNSILDFIVKNTSEFTPGSIIFSFISFPVFFFIGTGILFLIAKAFHGQGTFLRYIYCTLLINAFFYLFFGLLNLVRISANLTNLINLVAIVYQIILLIFMTMAIHRLPGSKATLAVLIPFIILFVISILLAIIILAVIFSSIR